MSLLPDAGGAGAGRVQADPADWVTRGCRRGRRSAASVAGRDEPLVFETRNAIALAASRLAEVVTLWPGRDAYGDHTPEALGGQPFTLFSGLKPVPHVLYLAHDTHFALSGVVTVEVRFELARPGSEPLSMAWEYWDGETWRGFKDFVEPGPVEPSSVFESGAQFPDSVDGTLGLTRSGIVRLAADCSETAKTTRQRDQGVLGACPAVEPAAADARPQPSAGGPHFDPNGGEQQRHEGRCGVR